MNIAIWNNLIVSNTWFIDLQNPYLLLDFSVYMWSNNIKELALNLYHKHRFFNDPSEYLVLTYRLPRTGVSPVGGHWFIDSTGLLVSFISLVRSEKSL